MPEKKKINFLGMSKMKMHVRSKCWIRRSREITNFKATFIGKVS